MEGALKFGLLGLRYSEINRPPTSFSSSNRIHGLSKRPLCVAVSRIGNEVIGEDIMRTFVMDRQTNGDLISKATDLIWRRDEFKLDNLETSIPEGNQQQSDEVINDEDAGGFLKLAKTRAWVSGEEVGPVNKRLAFKEWQDEVEKRTKLNFLKYEALKSEMLVLTIGIGAACTVYCLIGFSFEKKVKKIGIRSEDLQNAVEKTLKGSAMALSSPRIVLPAAIYGLWALSHKFLDNYFDFQLVPGMFGFFAYKAAALVQVYRDNQDLLLIFPEQDEF